MSSRRHIRKRGCRGKRRYGSLLQAQICASVATRKTRQKINAYPCRNCGGYHIGHAPRRVSRRLGL